VRLQKLAHFSFRDPLPDASVDRPKNRRLAFTSLTGGIIVKKFTYFLVGIPLLLICGSIYSSALDMHNAFVDRMQWFNSFPESGGLIVIGTVLIFGASVLRRRRAARSR